MSQACGYRILYTDGRELLGQVQLPADADKRHAIVRQLAQSVVGEGNNAEHVNVFVDGEYRDMFVDEIGHAKDLPLNEAATVIYRNNVLVHEPGKYRPEELPYIVGDAILFGRKVWGRD
jgi:hypothetical protein